MCNPKAEDNKQADAVNNNPRRRAMTKSSKQQKERSRGSAKGSGRKDRECRHGECKKVEGRGIVEMED